MSKADKKGRALDLSPSSQTTFMVAWAMSAYIEMNEILTIAAHV